MQLIYDWLNNKNIVRGWSGIEVIDGRFHGLSLHLQAAVCAKVQARASDAASEQDGGCADSRRQYQVQVWLHEHFFSEALRQPVVSHVDRQQRQEQNSGKDKDLGINIIRHSISNSTASTYGFW